MIILLIRNTPVSHQTQLTRMMEILLGASKKSMDGSTKIALFPQM